MTAISLCLSLVYTQLKTTVGLRKCFLFLLLRNPNLIFIHSDLTWPNITDKLPPEVLDDIFSEYVSRASRSPSNKGIEWLAPLLLSSVCSRWRDIAINNGTLWALSDLGASLHPELMKLFLERAGNHPQKEYTVSIKDEWIFDKLPIMVENLDRFEKLDLVMTYEERVDPEFEEYISVTQYEAGERWAMASTSPVTSLQELPPIHDKKASQLTSARLCIRGADVKHSFRKFLWGTSILRSAPNLRVLDLEIPGFSDSYIPWKNLQDLTIHVDGGLSIDHVLYILASAPHLQFLRTSLKNMKPLPTRRIPTRIRDIHHQNIKMIELSGSRVLPSLEILYECITDAPKLEDLIVKSTSFWHHETFLAVLDNLPRPIKTFELDVRNLPQEWVIQYLKHPNIDRSLKSLHLRGSHRRTRHDMSDLFLQSLTLIPNQQRILPDLEHLTFENALSAKDGLLSAMIESRLQAGAEARMTLRVESESVEHSFLVDHPQDLHALARLRCEYPDQLRPVHWRCGDQVLCDSEVGNDVEC